MVLPAVAHATDKAVDGSSTTSKTSYFRRNLATIIMAGFGGAVLGLSTLSFYGSPQNHIDNITTGFFLGLAGGGVYVASQSYTNTTHPEDSYSQRFNSPGLWSNSNSTPTRERRIFLTLARFELP